MHLQEKVLYLYLYLIVFYMATKPGILTDWPWTPLGRFKVVFLYKPMLSLSLSLSHTHTICDLSLGCKCLFVQLFFKFLDIVWKNALKWGIWRTGRIMVRLVSVWNNCAAGLNTLLFHPCTVDEQIFSDIELSATNLWKLGRQYFIYIYIYIYRHTPALFPIFNLG